MTAAIDWAAPLELLDGTPVKLAERGYRDGPNPDSDGDYCVETADGDRIFFGPDGEGGCDYPRLQNRGSSRFETALADLERAKAAFRDATKAGRDLPPEAEFGRLEDAYFAAQIAFMAALDAATGGLAKRIADVVG